MPNDRMQVGHCAALILGAAALIAFCGCQASGQTKPPMTQPSVKQIRARLRAVIADDTRYSALDTGHLPIPSSIMYFFFRPRYAREKLIAEGRVIIEPLLEIVGNPAEDKEVIERAWDVLFQFDDLRISAALIEQAKARGLAPVDLFILIAHDVGIDDLIMKWAGVDEQVALQWLQNLVASADYSPVLKLLDVAVQDTSGRGVLFGADHLIRWLNRYGDLDIDELLAKEAPSALVWRNEQLAKGYDPLVAFQFEREFDENQLAHALAR